MENLLQDVWYCFAFKAIKLSHNIRIETQETEDIFRFCKWIFIQKNGKMNKFSLL